MTQFKIIFSICFPLILYWSPCSLAQESVPPAASEGGGFELGVGTNSATSGRLVPALTGSLVFTQWSVTVTSTGVQTKRYYHSAYMGTVNRIFAVGSLMGGVVRAGFGLGLFYAKRGLLESDGATEEVSDDLTAGPSFHVNWTIFSSLYLHMEAMYGVAVKPDRIIVLSTQDLVTFAVGWRF